MSAPRVRVGDKAEPKSIASCQHTARRWLSHLYIPALLAACQTANGASADFQRFEFDTGTVRQTLLTGAFLDAANGADIALVARSDRREQPHLMILSPNDDAQPPFEARLSPATLFVDSARIAGRERLVAYEPGRVSWFDPATGAQHLLVEVETRYRSHEARIPKLHIMRDLNGDGRDDLLLPDTDGFWIAVQSETGTFAAPRKLGPPDPYLAATALGASQTYAEDGITATNMPWYLRRAYQADFNHDGRDDLVFWNKPRFDVHFQNAQGDFEAVAKRFPVAVPFDTDGAYALMFEYTDQNMLALLLGLRKKTQLTMLHALQDLNEDGVADLITVALEGRRLGNHRSTYQAYFGQATPEGTEFASTPNTTIRPRGTAGALQASGYSTATLRDFDGNGATDVFFTDVAVGFGGMVRAIAGRSVALNVEFYAMADGRYPRRATGKHRVRPRLYPVGEGVFFPPVLIGDVHGDGHADLVVGHARDELRIYAGDATEPWRGRPQRVSVELPDDERDTSLADLDGDGKQDVLVYDASRTPHRLTVLMAL